MYENQNSEKFEMFNIFKVVIIILTFLLIYNHYYKTAPIMVRIKDPKFSLFGPFNTTDNEINDVYDQLIDLKNFTFKINPQLCQDYAQGILLVVIISSKPDNYRKRTIIRDTWGRSIDSTKVLFLIGESNNRTISKIIEQESFNYGDIVQGSFLDAYRNMTYKHVMGLKWVSHHCPTAKYVLKTDDDVAVNSIELRRFLARELSPWGAKGLITCKVLERAQVQRKKTNKWYVTDTEYAGKFYPTYCAGMAIIYSQDVVRRLLSTAQNIPYFWIDDVHITGVIAEKNGIARTPLDSLVLTGKRMNLLTSQGSKEVGQFLFGPQDLTTDKVLEIWKSIPE